MAIPEIREVSVSRYVTPLREGGSLPAIVEADDEFSYVLKFRGAGQGKKALISELIGGEVARALGLRMPEIVFMMLDGSFSKTEPDEEIQDLLRFSVGLNLGLHFLSGAITYDPLVSATDPLTASKIVLLDSLITNVDRTVKNTNLLMWKGDLWLIDHGASLFFHHAWDKWEEHARSTFPMIKEHVLLSQASQLPEAAHEINSKIDPEIIRGIVNLIPDEWLMEDTIDATPQQRKNIYTQFLVTRVSNLDLLVKEAANAR